MLRSLLSLPLVLATLPVLAAGPAPRDVNVTAHDNTALKATYFAAAKPGPAVLLLHMCNTNRKSWEQVGRLLSAAGIHVLTLDYRGFGESGGSRYDTQPPEEQQKLVAEKWPGDVDAAFAYLLSQPGVNKTRIGAGGGSCGVNQAVQVARRHPEVKSLVLLAGGTDRAGREFLRHTAWLPIFASAAADDQFDADAPRSMQWLTELSGNSRNRFVGFADGKHGTEIFGPHPELPRQIVAWFAETLITTPADAGTTVTLKKTSASEFLTRLEEPGGVASAVQMFHDLRRRDPGSYLFPEFVLNQVAYERLQTGQNKDAIELFKLNVDAYPASANAQDSLGDGYFADGQYDLALAASRRSLDLLPADKIAEQFKNGIRKNAQEKIEKVTAQRR